MANPRKLYRVTWLVAQHPVRPHERVERSANYQSAMHAGDQVEAVRRISPQLGELVGVWICTGGRDELEWTPVDPDSLPVSDRAQALTRKLTQHSPPFAALMRESEQ